jgi:hypothetical protein
MQTTRMKDTRCWAYRRGADGEMESKIFPSCNHIPVGAGWTDSPAKIDQVEVAGPAPSVSPPSQIVDSAEAAIKEADAANAELSAALGDDKEALIQRAQELGIKIDRRWGIETLKSAIINHVANDEKL